MRIIKLLHVLSHLKWIFLIWMMALMVYIFFFYTENPIKLVGTVIFLAGIMMGFDGLSDITKISEKEKKALLNFNYVKRQRTFLFVGTIVLMLISVLFFSVVLLFPVADKSLIADFTKLGYDCLVMILGLLCLVKQITEKAIYVNSLNNN